MRRVLGGATVAVAALAAGLALGGPSDAPAQGPAQLQAGVAAVDASWHVGASAGQYAGDCSEAVTDPGEPPSGACTFVDHESGTFDPTGHSIRRRPSYGIQSRLSVRALVVDGPAVGSDDRVAIVKNDFYIPQDLVDRRAAQLIEEQCSGCGIGAENLSMAVTHNHSSPFYSSTSWGVWTFQDVFDVRFYEYMAQKMADAVIAASGDMRPVRVGAASAYYDKSHRHSFGPAIADDGTPAGYPQSDQDHDLTVIRFDDVSNPGSPEPLANLINFSQHPEFLEGNDLISADYVGPFERMMDRETGAITVYTQGSVGTSEPERSTYHSIHERLEFSHRDYAQAELGARLMANSAKDTWSDIAAGTPEDPEKYVPFDDDPAVAMRDAWYPGPFSHPYPGVSNCRSDKGLAGDPQLPVIGLPDCEGVQSGLEDLEDLGVPEEAFDQLGPFDPGLSTDDFQALGIPVPENYKAPSYAGVQEDIDVHLQAIRIGEILLPACSCEQWWDQSRNIELRTDKVPGNETLPGNLGYDWGAQCTADGNGSYEPDGTGTGTWHCPNPGNPLVQLPYALSDLAVKRMRAQVNNPANGWNDVANVASADSEPVDTTQIKGNYTHDDDAASAARGYELTVPIGMVNDYNGYIASYREFQRGDHYRKALTGWGPHSSDYMASRLVTLARLLNGMPASERPQDQKDEDLLAAKAVLDTQLNEQRATALGTNGGAAIVAYEAALPDDGGEAEVVTQPQDVERFSAAFLTWNGGSNFTDNPVVTVEREVAPGQWETYADQSGEIPVTLDFPELQGDGPAYLQGDQDWLWTAHFEVFVAGAEDVPVEVNAGDPAATPPGSYRFVVDGQRREGGQVESYSLTSDPFEVRVWDGILVQDLKLEPDGTISFVLGPRSQHQVAGAGFTGPGGATFTDVIGPIDYPDSYESPARFIRNQRRFARDRASPNDPDLIEWFCFTCSFRPWIDFGDAESASVTITLADGQVQVVPAHREGGRWVTDRVLGRGETARVRRGDVLDPHGNTNEPSILLSKGGPGDCAEPRIGGRGPDSLLGTPAGDLLRGRGGNDLIRGGAGDDCLGGGPGRDRLLAGGGADSARGGDGADLVKGSSGADRLHGGRGRDRVRGGAGADRIMVADHHVDRVRCGGGRDRVKANRRDRLAGDCERARLVGRRR